MTSALVPLRERLPRFFGQFEKDMENLIEQFFTKGGPMMEGFAPKTSIAETDKQFEVTVDLPGIQPKEVQVEMRGNELWLTGERKQEKEEKGKNFHRVEQQYGRFDRVIPLPVAVDEGKIEAHYQDGVLKITVPKSEAVRPKRIPITT